MRRERSPDADAISPSLNARALTAALCERRTRRGRREGSENVLTVVSFDEPQVQLQEISLNIVSVEKESNLYYS